MKFYYSLSDTEQQQQQQQQQAEQHYFQEELERKEGQSNRQEPKYRLKN